MCWNRIWQIPAQRATAPNNQELPKTFRNLDSEIALSQFGVLQNASNCNKRMPQNAELQNGGRRCSRRMAHSDNSWRCHNKNNTNNGDSDGRKSRSGRKFKFNGSGSVRLTMRNKWSIHSTLSCTFADEQVIGEEINDPSMKSEANCKLSQIVGSTC